MIFSSWYTDLVDVWRVVNTTESGLTRQVLTKVLGAVPCRVYTVATNNWTARQGAAVSRADEKLSCAVDTDIRAGDTLYITRGGALNSGRTPERYIASNPKAYYDPVGGALTGLQHLQVGLTADNINSAEVTL